jgi:MFS family permease
MAKLPQSHAPRRRLSVLRQPGVLTVVAASFLARLPLSMMGLATIFFVQERSGSIAAAGLAVAAFSMTAAVGAPWRGRFVDRRGIRGGLLPLALVHAAATAAFLVVAPLPHSGTLFVVVAGLGGATAPPVNAAMRALWPSLVAKRDRDAAYGLEAVLQEISYIAGPLLAGLLISLFSVDAPIAVSAVLVVAGGLLFSLHPAASRLGGSQRAVDASLRTTGMKALVASLAMGAVALGVLEVAVPAFSEENGSAAGAGLLISAMSVASLVGGVWYGMLRWRAAASSRLIAALGLATVGYALTPFAGSIGGLAPGLLIFGLTLAPTLAVTYAILDELAPAGAAVESLTWVTAASAGGAALGAMGAGLVIEQASIQTALGVGVGAMLLATAIPAIWRDDLLGSRDGGQAVGPGTVGEPEAEPWRAAMDRNLEVAQREVVR